MTRTKVNFVNFVLFVALSSIILSSVVFAEEPEEVDLYVEGEKISEPFNLTEDEVAYITFNTTLIEGPFIFSVSDIGGRNLCSVPNPSEGIAECLPTHFVLTGTNNPAPEVPIDYTVRFRAEQVADSGVAVFRSFTFTLIPVNDQAIFTDSTKDELSSTIEVNATETHIINITGFDEEADYDLQFFVVSASKQGSPHAVFPEEKLRFLEEDRTETSQLLSVSPSNFEAGDWTITLNVTDNGSSELPPSSLTFNLTVYQRETDPVFLSDFSNIEGVQGENFSFRMSARDLNQETYNLNFRILHSTYNETNPFCTPEIFPWNDPSYLSPVFVSPENSTYELYVDNLTNEHVICRFVDIEAYNETIGISSIYRGVFLNITNKNDAPIVHELSFHPENTVGNNMSDLSVRLFETPAVFFVNATDPDEFTYDKENTGIITYSSSNELFPINNTTGMMHFTFTNDLMVGTWLVNITVTDNAPIPLNYTRTMSITVFNNTAPRISNVIFNETSSQGNITLIQFDTIDDEDVKIGLIDFESNIQRFNKEIYNFSLKKISSVISDGENITTWQINLTDWIINETNSHPEESRPNQTLYSNALVGTHDFVILAVDEFGAFDLDKSTARISFFVENENDPPFFDMTQNNLRDEITFDKIVIGGLFNKVIRATDFDLYLPSDVYEETLTYTVEFDEPDSFENIQLVKSNENEAILSFRPFSTGLFNITLMVMDSSGKNDTQRVSLRVFNQTQDPVFHEIKPYLLAGQTVENFSDASTFISPLTLPWQENQTLVFDANITIDPVISYDGGETFEDNSLIVEWFVDGELKKTITGAKPKQNTSLSLYFDFFSSGINNVTMVATDSVSSSSSWTWLVNVENVNRPPSFCEDSINEIVEVSRSLILENYLGFYHDRQRFYNPDDDPLNTGPGSISDETFCAINYNNGLRLLPSLAFNYTFTNPDEDTCNLDIDFDGTSVRIIAYSVGFCRVRFTAIDLDSADPSNPDTAVSSSLGILVKEAITQGDIRAEREVRVTERITIPIEEEVDVPKITKIIYPGKLITYYNQTIEIPLVLRNDWSEELKRISLSATLLNYSSDDNLENDIVISFSKKDIPSLDVGAQEEVKLILSNYREQGPLMISVFADVEDPEFTDSDTIILAGLEMSGDSPQNVRALVSYARDLLTASPECGELNDILDAAQRALEQGQVDEAMRLIDGAINGCRYLLSQEELLRRERPSNLKVGLDFTSKYWSEIMYSSLALVFVAMLFYVIGFVRLSLKKK